MAQAPDPMRALLRLLQGAAIPGGERKSLDAELGRETVDALIASKLLVRGARATRYPCPRGGSHCPREVVPNVGDPEHPFVAVPPSGELCCDPLPLTEADLATWTFSYRAFAATLARLFAIRGEANVQNEVFPATFTLGRCVHAGLERDALLMLDLNGSAPASFLRARQAQGQPTVVFAHARSRFVSPEIDAHFRTGPVVVVFLEDELEVGFEGVRRRADATLVLADNVATPAAFCAVVDAGGRRTIDEAEYRRIVASAEDYDLFLDTTTTVDAGRYACGRREGGAFVRSAVTSYQGLAYAELMRRHAPLRAAELEALRGVNHPEKLVEAARKEVDVQLSRYKWRATELLRGDGGKAKQYWFKPPAELRWVVLATL
jgi:hypothetical protein